MLTIKVNRKQDFRGTWLRVGDADWLDLGSELDATGDGQQEVDLELDDLDHWDTDAWAANLYLPVGVYDGEPDSGSTLYRRQPVKLWTAEMTVRETPATAGAGLVRLPTSARSTSPAPQRRTARWTPTTGGRTCNTSTT